MRGGSRYRVIWPRIRAGWRRKGSSRLPCRSGHHIAMDSMLHRFVLAEIAPAVHGGWRVGAYRIRGNRACLRLPSVAEHQTRMGRIMDNTLGAMP